MFLDSRQVGCRVDKFPSAVCLLTLPSARAEVPQDILLLPETLLIVHCNNAMFQSIST